MCFLSCLSLRTITCCCWRGPSCLPPDRAAAHESAVVAVLALPSQPSTYCIQVLICCCWASKSHTCSFLQVNVGRPKFPFTAGDLWEIHRASLWGLCSSAGGKTASDRPCDACVSVSHWSCVRVWLRVRLWFIRRQRKCMSSQSSPDTDIDPVCAWISVTEHT